MTSSSDAESASGYLSGDHLHASPRPSIDQLEARYRDRGAILGIVGMGYVGLPLMLAAAAAGYRVVGFDVDVEKVEAINSGKSYFKHIDNELVASAVHTRSLRATTKFAEIEETDAIIICVPTPLTANREPDLTFVERTTEAIAPHLQKGQLVIWNPRRGQALRWK